MKKVSRCQWPADPSHGFDDLDLDRVKYGGDHGRPEGVADLTVDQRHWPTA